jgi:hypothetical protein
LPERREYGLIRPRKPAPRQRAAVSNEG